MPLDKVQADRDNVMQTKFGSKQANSYEDKT